MELIINIVSIFSELYVEEFLKDWNFSYLAGLPGSERQRIGNYECGKLSSDWRLAKFNQLNLDDYRKNKTSQIQITKLKFDRLDYLEWR